MYPTGAFARGHNKIVDGTLGGCLFFFFSDDDDNDDLNAIDEV